MMVSDDSVGVPLPVILWIGGIAVSAIAIWASTMEKRIRDKLGRQEYHRDIILQQMPLKEQLNRMEIAATHQASEAGRHREAVSKSLHRLERSVAVLDDRAGRSPTAYSKEDDTGSFPLGEG